MRKNKQISKHKAVEFLLKGCNRKHFWFDIGIDFREVDHAPRFAIVFQPFLFELQFGIYDIRHAEDR